MTAQNLLGISFLFSLALYHTMETRTCEQTPWYKKQEIWKVLVSSGVVLPCRAKPHTAFCTQVKPVSSLHIK